jgi:hypothetical protein
LARDYPVDIGQCLTRGWALVKAHFGSLFGMTALFLLLLAITESVLARLGEIHSESGREIYDGPPLLGLLLIGPLFGGLLFYFLKTMRGEPVKVETAFAGFGPRFLHLFLVHLVASFLIGLGFVCFILPGIYLLVAWSFALVLVMDRGLDFWPAMELSRKVVNKNWWPLLALLLVLGVLGLSGLLVCGIGLLVTLPVALASFLYAYEDGFGVRQSMGAPVPPPPIARPTPTAATSQTAPAGATGPTGTAVVSSSPAPLPAVGSSRGSKGKIVLIGLAAGLLFLIMFVLLCAVLFMSFEHVSAITPRHIPSKASFWLTILIALPSIGLVSLLSAVWFHYRTKSQLGSQPRSSVGRTGRILLIVLFGLDGLLLLLVLWLAAWSALGSHYRESRVFQVHAIQPPSFMPTPPAMPSLPAMPSAP